MQLETLLSLAKQTVQGCVEMALLAVVMAPCGLIVGGDRVLRLY
jgi:hypothetical protein